MGLWAMLHALTLTPRVFLCALVMSQLRLSTHMMTTSHLEASVAHRCCRLCGIIPQQEEEVTIDNPEFAESLRVIQRLPPIQR